MSRTTGRDLRIGLLVLVTAAGLLGLLVVASGGPGYLSMQRTDVEVTFRDAQGLRAGQSVRVAGLDAGRVVSLELKERDGQVRALVRISIPSDLATRLKQDAVVTIQASLTGQTCVNIASLGESGVSWVPGQPIEGVESSLFDPILEQVGLGPIERGHISHVLGEIRLLVDDISPRTKKTLLALQQASADIQATTEAASPTLIEAAERIGRIAPHVEDTISRLEALVAQVDETVRVNRPAVDQMLANLRDVSATTKGVIDQAGPRVGPLIDGLERTRARAERTFYNAETISANTASLLARNQPDLERTIGNVRDATDYARMTTQKVFANPLMLSPLYTPSREDKAAQADFDTAQEFLQAAREFTDAVKRLQAVRNDPLTANQQQLVDQMLQRASVINQNLDPIARRLAEGVQSEPKRGLIRQPNGPRN
jgi:phospholipid/cholesterol/gamma-HCH transport system substrate-binding protein